MTIAETLLWYVIAILQWGCLSTIYRENPFYDTAEGLALGATAAISVMDNWVNVQRLIIQPLQTNFAANWWVLFSIILASLYITVYSRKLVEIFRLVVTFTMSISIGLLVRDAAGTAWAQVKGSGRITDFGSLVMWIVCIGGFFYFIFSKKLDNVLRIPREFGRWVMIMYIGIVLAPMFLRYTEGAIFWTAQINTSPAWWIPFIYFGWVVYEIITKRSRSKTQVAKATT